MATIKLEEGRLLHKTDGWGGEAWKSLALDVATSSRPTRIFMIVAHRTAWHGADAANYHGFYVDLDSAKRGVEGRRTRGSAWVIKELPACAFIGENYSLLATQINSNRPLSNSTRYHSGVRPLLGTIRSALLADFFLSQLQNFVVAEHPFRVHSANFQRGWPTSWPSRETEKDCSGVREVSQIHSRSVDECTFLGVLYEYADAGQLVTALHPRSPLVAEGVLVGDVLGDVSVDGASPLPFAQALESIRPGGLLEWQIRRGDETHTLHHRASSFRQAFASSAPASTSDAG